MDGDKIKKTAAHILDLTDRRLAFQQFMLAAGVAVGTSFLAMGGSFFAASGSVDPSRVGVLISLSIEYGVFGGALLLITFVVAHFTFRSTTSVRKQLHRIYSPKTQDNFVVVIEGIGNHGNPEKVEGVDNVMENAVRTLIANETVITSARFYSTNGVRNLLKQQL